MKIVGDDVEFDYWEYGEVKSLKISVDKFLKGMKGYWIPEQPNFLGEEEEDEDE